jgi:hypothetical protein
MSDKKRVGMSIGEAESSVVLLGCSGIEDKL